MTENSRPSVRCSASLTGDIDQDAQADRPATEMPEFSTVERVGSDIASDEVLTDLRGER